MQAMKTHLKKGDNVVVIAGKEKSKQGVVTSLVPKKNGVIVEGLNMVKRHIKAKNNQEGGIVEKESYIHVSNVMVYCSKCSKPVRVKINKLENGDKQRVCSKCSVAL